MLLALVGSLVACTSDPSVAVPDLSAAATTTSVEVADDGVLTLGLLVPLSGEGAVLGRSVREGVALAVADINKAGGVNGAPVRLTVREEGQNFEETQSAITKLAESGVDAIVGPVSSVTALASLDQIVSRGLIACSPTAAAMALDDFPDRGMFVRTIPSDSLQAAAIASAVERTGTARASIAYIDDAYGRPFAKAVTGELVERGIVVSASVPFTPDSTALSAAARVVADDGADTVVVLAASIDGPAMLRALATSEGDAVPRYIVNGDQQGEALAAAASGAFAERVSGVRAIAIGESPEFDERLALTAPSSDGLYSLNAYDCATLIALAAEANDGLRPTSGSIISASTGGTDCASFVECAAAISTGRNTNYNGPGGRVALNANGDPAAAAFEVFQFGSNGRVVDRVRINASY